jgi:hypothetical protein
MGRTKNKASQAPAGEPPAKVPLGGWRGDRCGGP